MEWPLAALTGGIVLLVISADKFVQGAAETSSRLGLPPLLVGMLVIGFGSSMPEMVISALAASQGNPGLALGNAIGSNITNIALILGVTALVTPIAVRSRVLRWELPMLVAVTALAGVLLLDDSIDELDGWLLIFVFALIMTWTVLEGLRTKDDQFGLQIEKDLQEPLSPTRAWLYLIGGLLALVLSSRILVWGGVEIARFLGISDLIIGLTVVAIGTSLPELASSIAAVRKNEHDLAIGNVIGSNMFNITIVMGIAATIAPSTLDPAIWARDLPVLGLLTTVLMLTCWGFRGEGRITRWEGALLIGIYVLYNSYLVYGVATT
jgi:cation:H+ antiporter